MRTARPRGRFRELPRYLLAPVPLALLQPLLERIVRRIAARHPRLFARLGPHASKSFLIRPTNLPLVLLLTPDPRNPRIRAFRDERDLIYQASITGSFLNLLRLLDGSGDSDAIFFSRDLRIDGDTEAAVSLRNALDDVEGSIAGDIADLFGPLGRGGLAALRRIEV